VTAVTPSSNIRARIDRTRAAVDAKNAEKIKAALAANQALPERRSPSPASGLFR